MTVRDVADYLNVDEKTVYRLVQRRELPGFKVAGTWRFRRAAIDTWIEASQEGSVVRSRTAPRMRALVVEDDEVDRVAVRRAIRESDPLGAVEIVEVGTLADARAALGSGQWDCVVVDRRLPDGDGISLLEGARELVGSAAVVMLTGVDDEQNARNALRNGAQDYLIKGRIDGQTLIRSLRYAIERKRSDDQRRLWETNFRSLIDGSPDAICLFRCRQVVHANLAFCVLVGCAGPDELVGRSASELIHPEDEPRLPHLTPATAPAGEPLFETRLRSASGQWIVAEGWTRGVVLDEGQAVLLVCRDLTRRKVLEEQVLLSERMAAVGNLAAGMVQEINNPLSCVIANLEFASDELADLKSKLEGDPRLAEQAAGAVTCAAEGLEALEEARKGAARIKQLIRDLKGLTRPVAGNEAAGPVKGEG
jgi:excisionase family DNA binding protein/PAS domain S-box-containing protein